MSLEGEPSDPQTSRVRLVGPFESYQLVIDGRPVPHLTAAPKNGGMVHLTLDDRYGLDLPVEDFDRVARFIADSIAVAKGYTCHPREDWDGPKPLPDYPRLSRLD